MHSAPKSLDFIYIVRFSVQKKTFLSINMIPFIKGNYLENFRREYSLEINIIYSWIPISQVFTESVMWDSFQVNVLQNGKLI